MSNEKILVSVIMPTYHQQELLHKAILSVLKQTYSNFELIIVDDNKDEELKKKNFEFVRELNDSRVYYLSNEKNIGSVASRNRGIYAAKGEYITFLDDDDLYEDKKIELQLQNMIQNQSDFSVCDLVLKNEKGKIVDIRKRNYLRYQEPLLLAHLKYHITGTSTFMFKTNYLKEIGAFNSIDFGDEFYLMYNAIRNGGKFSHLSFEGVIAEIHDGTGLSNFENKLKCEKAMFEFKSSLFPTLKKCDIRYIKMRHYAVLAVAYKKGKKIGKSIGCLFKSFFLSPKGFIRILTKKDR